MLIVSDGGTTHWINAHTGNPVRSTDSLPTFNAKSLVDGSATSEYRQAIETIVDQADHSLSAHNDDLHTPSLIDPSQLAQTIWQKIWINTGKEPEKCLYNVVELFVFKFLSDLGVLEPHNDFNSVCALDDSAGHAPALTHYANISRPAIHQLFPDGDDGTGIINGTIFVNEQGEPNKSQARLFCEVLNDLRDHDSEYGSFKYIDKEFKTRLYESFLRQGAGLHHLGQFFTPRNVVRAIIEMSGANDLPPGASICDPFCGVGGFLLEAILQNPRLMASFKPTNGVIGPDISLIGYDRGSDEKEDERTIILAKANALIYFSDLIARYNGPGFTEEFARKVINPMFRLVRTNVGTFGIDDAARHDLILTNPPYVTRGSSSLKGAIAETGLADRYAAPGRGTEALALQWIVRSLRGGGTAIAIVPDGLLNQKGMLDFVKQHCLVRAVISLPVRTFYATPKKTYVLAIVRKRDDEPMQQDPIFAYLASETGETRDANRWPTARNDLDEAASLYNQFKGSPTTFQSPALRCHVLAWPEFNALDHWMLDRVCWDADTLRRLGAEKESEPTYSIDEFNGLLGEAASESIRPWNAGQQDIEFTEVQLGDQALFSLQIGRRVLKRDCVEGGIPCISANVRDVFGYVAESEVIRDFDAPSLTWGIDGNFDWCFIERGPPFHPTDHCGVLRVLHEHIAPEYLY
ncbi:MAG: N-6 DNA methylase, partial [Chloroflexota bacterium]|nr:N-6 DNA methylase [Chloroflexota bacterium]